ncbi:carbonic anhydrase 2, partial [Vibrio parahaemolyticus V-223/04]
TLQNKFIT